jgi:acyl-CoA thioester hydrolase
VPPCCATAKEEAALKDDTRAPALFFAPFVSSAMRVESQWIDYNGHLNMAYYHVLFDRAVDEVFSLVGFSQDYIETRNASTFTAECHILYKRELTEADIVRVTAQLIAFDEKRLQTRH